MQNKANFQKAKMNITSVLTRNYENNRRGEHRKNKPNSNPIKANSNPIRTQLKPISKPIKPNQIQHLYKLFLRIFPHFQPINKYSLAKKTSNSPIFTNFPILKIRDYIYYGRLFHHINSELRNFFRRTIGS